MEKMIRCKGGHFYDENKHSSCPYCGVDDLKIGETKGKKPGEDAPSPPVGNDSPVETQGRHARHEQDVRGRPRVGQDVKTVGYWGKKIDPVVGWLICIDGTDKGRDYRIRGEKNFIGRSPQMDIFIENDERISRKNHAVISYNPRNNKFKLLPGEGRALVYLNDDDVDSAAVLKAYDIIEMGESKFMFVPLCGEHFQWETKEKE